MFVAQFDDLGFGDTGYNGADYPTPILDELANNDAIKINFHYTEQVCVYFVQHSSKHMIKYNVIILTLGVYSIKIGFINWKIFMVIRNK